MTLNDTEVKAVILHSQRRCLAHLDNVSASLLCRRVHSCPGPTPALSKYFSGGEEEQGITPQLEALRFSVSPGLGMGCRNPEPHTGEKDEENASTTLYFQMGCSSLTPCEINLRLTWTMSEEGRKSPLVTAPPCKLLET